MSAKLSNVLPSQWPAEFSNVAPERSKGGEFDEVGGPGLSYCSIPGSQDAVEAFTEGANSGVFQSVYRLNLLSVLLLFTCNYCIKMS